MKKCNIPIGEKIKQVREAKKWSQEALGLAINISRTGVYHFESGNQPCPSNILWDIKMALGVKDLPFTEPERENFREKLYSLYELIYNDKLDEAKEELDKLSVITHLPLDKELSTLYNLCKVRMLLKQNNIELTGVILANINLAVVEFDNELKHLYYLSNGTLSSKSGNYKEGLDYYIKAREVMKGGFEENQWLFYNIARSIYTLGYIVNTITFIEDNCNLRLNEQTTRPIFAIEFLLAKCYMRIKNIKKARKLFESCLKKAESIGDELFIASVLVDLGYLHRIFKDRGLALDYIEKAFCYIERGSVNYLETFYQKVRCYVDMGDFSTSKNLLVEGKKLAQNNETYSILFECLGHLMTLNEDDSLEYLHEVALPYFLEADEKVAVLDCCHILQKQYDTRRWTSKKQLYVERILASIYKEMLEGNVDL